ncbi:Cytochrome P450 4c3 [Gryllus bimaculatus]|nr:Cytochrome P450 4c3 [Gryllus bimaculatus]
MAVAWWLAAAAGAVPGGAWGALAAALAAAAAVALAAPALAALRRRARVVTLIERIPGPPPTPLLGNTVEFNVDHDEVFTRLMAGAMLYNPQHGVVRGWNGSAPWVVLYRAPVAEAILGSNKHVEKSHEYRYLHPWLGTGLLTSGGAKWRARRKLLTPAFHFRILEDFAAVFHEQGAVLMRLLRPHADAAQPFNLQPFRPRWGVRLGSIVQNRQSKLWLQPDWLFRWNNLYKIHQRCIKILHGFSNKVIRERKEEIKKQKNEEKVKNKTKEILSNEDIREEVDTFMFEGHDTTSSAISWALFLLGCNPECQEKAVAELQDIFGDSRRPPTLRDLNEMRYLERCIKEALRLYPPVPMVARQLNEDARIGEYTVPAGTTAVIVTYMLHRDPQVFPMPDHFIPDRFLPENCAGRHPYAYIPFSAGPRNCIGQKFALLEEKALISSFLRHYRIEAVDRREDLTLLGELILRPKNGLNVRIFHRT